MTFTYNFPVVKGRQARRTYYIAMVPLKMISRLFPTDEDYVLPEHRAQRKLNISRIPVMSKYILENRDSYVFSALAASIDGESSFEEVDDSGEIGILKVSMDARFLINDGQHRKAAILEAIADDESLGEETIPIVFFEDLGLSRSQQIFTDLNKHAVKTSNSISELYDSRDDIAVVTRNVVASIPFLDMYTDKETDNLGKYSSKLFTLNTFYKANKRVLGGNADSLENVESFLKAFWGKVADYIEPWQELQRKEISKKELRETYIATQGVVIQAIGQVGLSFNIDVSKLDKLKHLEKVNWRRNSPTWRNRAIRSDGRIIASNKAIVLISNEIKRTLGLALNDDEQQKEELFNREFSVHEG